MTGVAAEVGSTANNYQILSRLATGGMAEIFLVRGIGTTGVERYCVLKRILRDRASDALFVRMFLDEARLAAQLQHPNIAQVYDIGKLGDSYFFTMEYVHGETVRALLQRARSLRRELPIGTILTVIAGAAAGLHHAHQRLGHDGRPLGIVHRDVSPSNLMVSYEGGVKLVDFGVAKAENRAQETRSGTVKGKISYLSPEQCRGGSVDRRSDLFSLGIVFWEMLTTERLYKRPSDFDNMTAIVSEDPALPSSRRPSVPPELDDVALRLLAKHPDDRYQTADELVEALEGVATKLGAMMSSGGLARFVRELFGQRPEPWLDLDAVREDSSEGITITNAPIADELAIGQTLDLAAAVRASAESLDAVVPSQLVTTPAVVRERANARRPLPLAAPPQTVVIKRPAEPASEIRSDPSIRPASRIWLIIASAAAAAIAGSLGVFAMCGGATEHAGVTSSPLPDPPSVDRDAPIVLALQPDAGVAAIDAEPGSIATEVERYAEVATRCIAEPTAKYAETCTLAACQAKNLVRARAWYAAIASAASRRTTASACRDLGVGVGVGTPKPMAKVEPSPTGSDLVVDPCVANPMSCQR